MKAFIEQSASLFVRTGRESCNKFLAKFLDLRIRPFVLRITGGCGNMTREYWDGMQNLEHALTGGKRGSKKLPLLAGFVLVGGTRMVNRFNPRKVRPGITEVIVGISRRCKDVKTLGIIAKVGDLKHSRYGIVCSDDCDKDKPLEDQYTTIVHPEQDAVMLVQPSADRSASWEDEAKECIDICDHLREGKWQGLMVVYNGGGVVRKEIEGWAELARKQRMNGESAFWRVLIIRGSGGTADAYANNAEFLADNPDVHVCENTVDDIRAKLLELGALVYPPQAIFGRGDRRK